MSTAPRADDTGGGSAPGRSRALVVVPQPAPAAGRLSGLGRSHGAVAAAVAVVMGVGFVAGTQAFASKPQAAAVASADPGTEVLYRVRDEVRSLRSGLDGLRAGVEDGRQVEAIRGLKRSVEALKQDLDGVKAASATVGQPDARFVQLATRLDRLERGTAAADETGSLPAGAAAAQPRPAPIPPPAGRPAPILPVPRPEVAKSEPAKSEPAKSEPAKADVAKFEPAKPDLPKPEAARPEIARVEVPAPRPAELAAKPDPAPRPAVVQGWLLRDVYGGVALVEGRAGDLREVAPGEFVPGAGEIRSIERRGRGWVVVTSRGVILADTRR